MAGTLIASLAACAPAVPLSPAETTTPSATTLPAETTPSTTTPEPTEPASAAKPIGLDCAALLPIEAVYELNPNLSVVPEAAPPAGSIAEALAREGGVACDLVHNSSQAILRVAAATPGSDALAVLRQASSESDIPMIQGFEVRADASTGALVAFRGEIAISVEADPYFDASSRQQVLQIAIDAIN